MPLGDREIHNVVLGSWSVGRVQSEQVAWQLDNVQPIKPAVPSTAEAWTVVVAAAVATLAAVSAAVGASEA
jgi:hypothetical protein